MSSPGEGSSSRPANPSHNSAHNHDIPTPIDGTSLHNYQFTFERSYEDAVAASIQIDADSCQSRRGSPDTHSITSDVTRYRYENGRTYHGYKDGSYMFPNDQRELDRCYEQYHLLKFVMNQRLFLAPWSERNPPRNVLDIATGSGEWAIEMGDMFPTAKVTGTDLSPIQPLEMPPNVHFYIEDAREPWDWYREDDKFDFIHTRVTLGCWNDIKEDILYKSFEALEPGGYFEAQELLCSILCDDDSMKPDHELKVHMEDIEDAAVTMGRPIRDAHLYKQAMEDVGFVDVKEITYKLPINGWPRERKFKTLGKRWEDIWLNGIHAYSSAPLTRMMLVKVRQSISDQSVHAYNKFYVVVGRKPYPNEKVQTQPSGSSGSSGDTEMGGVS
ncbi:hypothetical protein TruAng_001149 [Truncatella angustata]|nr:hypothetical protein TruAng_001149 [Truncatella angustata]